MTRRNLEFAAKDGPKAPDGSPVLRAELDTLLRNLQSWEHPANESEIAVLYRDLLAEANVTAQNGRPARHWGADPHKVRTEAAL